MPDLPPIHAIQLLNDITNAMVGGMFFGYISCWITRLVQRGR